MNITLDVPVGKYRNITPEELATLEKLTGESTKTEEASIAPAVEKEISDKSSRKEGKPRQKDQENSSRLKNSRNRKDRRSKS